jgi:hypothetical protein
VAVLVARGASPEVVFRTVAAEVSKVLDTDVTLIGRYEADSTFNYHATVGDHLPVSWVIDVPTRELLGGANRAVAGVVHDNINWSVPKYSLDGSADGLAVAHVKRLDFECPREERL